MEKSSYVFGISGWKDSGKTTLISELIKEFSARGYSVSSIKHAHHAFDIDHEGTDSFKHRKSGAKEVLLSSSKRYALMHEIADEAEEPDLAELLSKMSKVDIVLVEGFKASDIPKLQTIRSDSLKNNGKSEINNTVAYAADIASFDQSQEYPVFDIDDIAMIADFITDFLKLSLKR